MKYSVIIPAYNEERFIGTTIDTLHEFFSHCYDDFEIILADDGSTDETARIGTEKARQYSSIKIVRSERNVGRGAMLKKAFAESEGEIKMYTDADLSVHPRFFHGLIEAIQNGADIAIGSRHMRESEISSPLARHIVSAAHPLIVRFLLGSSVGDYQCGFKAFRNNVLSDILPYVMSDGWSWDTEVLVKSAWRGYRIAEVPVAYIDYRKSRVRLLKDSFAMGLHMLRLRSERPHFISRKVHYKRGE